MPTGGSAEPELLVDTSVAVALVVSDHEHHEATFEALGSRRLGLAGHAAFETFSVLTRLPPPARRTPGAVARLLGAGFPHTRFLSAGAAASLLLDDLPSRGIGGGSIYDALVAGAAAEHGLGLVTRDSRALEVYRAFGIPVELLT
jgi:predicted nucleic acid-binding protein